MAKRVKGTGAAPRKKSRKDREEEEADQVFLYEEDKEPKDTEQESDEEVPETAEEKRLRLAKDYLDNLRAAAEADPDGEEGAMAGGLADALGERLRQEAMEASGRLQRRIAARVAVPVASTSGSAADGEGGHWAGAGRFVRAHGRSVTALALAHDDATAWTVAKDGSIYRWDVETMKKTALHRPGHSGRGAAPGDEPRRAEWLGKAARRGGGRSSLLAAAVSSDGAFLAVGGGDSKVHVFDARSGSYLQAYAGHRDIVTGLAFREGTHTLLSASFDRTVKLWSLDDNAYVDTLFGHQAEVLAVDAARSERAVSAGHDRSCRMWKIPEESQLVFRAPTLALDCCRYVTATEWITGANDGGLQVWNQLKKKPVAVVKGAHGRANDGAGAAAPPPSGSWAVAGSAAEGWVQSVGVCRGSDLVASGAGDGEVKLWEVTESKHGGAGGLRHVGSLPARGFVNGLALARSGRFAMAALGQEPRLGSWGRVQGVRNGVLLHPLSWEGGED